MVTFIQLPSVVELDLERALDREFSEWFEAEINRQDDDNKAAASTLVKDLLIRGYLMTITARSAQQDSSEVKAVEDRRRVELERIVENACRAEAEKSRAEHMAQIDNSRNERVATAHAAEQSASIFPWYRAFCYSRIILARNLLLHDVQQLQFEDE